MARQATEKKQVMSFEEMAESAKSAGLPTEFKFDESPVRVVMKGDQPWFVAKDVCDILGIANPRDAIADFDDDEKGVVKTDTLGGPQELNAVNESGLYNLIFTSRKPEAKRFRKWVTVTVLPEIRKTGSYQGLGGYIGLKDDEVDYERWLLERALLDAQIIAIEMQRIGVHFLQQMTDDPEMGAARANQNLDEFHDAVRDNMQRSLTFLDRARPGTRWTQTKK
jgi:prophage antirepressor-like protein